MAKFKIRRIFVLLLGIVLVTPAYLNGQALGLRPANTSESLDQKPNAAMANTPAATPLPDPVVAPLVVVEETPSKTSLPNHNGALPSNPITNETKSILSDLPASKRLAISLFAGLLTLVAALWIGARRD